MVTYHRLGSASVSFPSHTWSSLRDFNITTFSIRKRWLQRKVKINKKMTGPQICRLRRIEFYGDDAEPWQEQEFPQLTYFVQSITKSFRERGCTANPERSNAVKTPFNSEPSSGSSVDGNTEIIPSEGKGKYLSSAVGGDVSWYYGMRSTRRIEFDFFDRRAKAFDVEKIGRPDDERAKSPVCIDDNLLQALGQLRNQGQPVKSLEAVVGQGESNVLMEDYEMRKGQALRHWGSLDELASISA